MAPQRIPLNRSWQLIGDTPLEVEAQSAAPVQIVLSDGALVETPDMPITRVFGNTGSGTPRLFDAPGLKVYARSGTLVPATIIVTPRTAAGGPTPSSRGVLRHGAKCAVLTLGLESLRDSRLALEKGISLQEPGEVHSMMVMAGQRLAVEESRLLAVVKGLMELG